MKSIEKRLPDAELEIMKVIWHNPTPISTSEVKRIIDEEGVNDWTQQTVQTLLNRLITKEFISKDSLKFDPNGSYTGKTKNKYEEPVQDADDL